MSVFPPSDHCDGARFFNPAGPAARGFGDLPKWWWQRWRGSAVPWPKKLPPAPPVTLTAVVAPDQLAATFIGHATFLLQFSDCTVLTDPVFATHAGPFGLLGPARVCPPALALGALPRIDVVVVSHNHYDHLDLASLRWLSRHRSPQFIVPLGLRRWLEARGILRVTELDWWQDAWPYSGLGVTCTPAQHWSSRAPWDRCRTLWGGFLFRRPQGPIYFCGDSGWNDHFAQIRARLGAPLVSFLPIGAYEPRWFMEPVHMNPDEAVRAHLALGSRTTLGMHHATFCLTDEAIDAPVQELELAKRRHEVAGEAFTAPTIGQTVICSL